MCTFLTRITSEVLRSGAHWPPSSNLASPFLFTHCGQYTLPRGMGTPLPKVQSICSSRAQCSHKITLLASGMVLHKEQRNVFMGYNKSLNVSITVPASVQVCIAFINWLVLLSHMPEKKGGRNGRMRREKKGVGWDGLQGGAGTAQHSTAQHSTARKKSRHKIWYRYHNSTFFQLALVLVVFFSAGIGRQEE